MASAVRQLVGLDRVRLKDLIRATLELGIARLRLRSQHMRTLMSALPAESTKLDSRQSALVDRVAFAIPRVAVRLPWRADCLVQALAAHRWLDRHGIATTVTLGVPTDMPADFEAHAWLMAGDRVVTGGDISRYAPFTRP